MQRKTVHIWTLHCSIGGRIFGVIYFVVFKLLIFINKNIGTGLVIDNLTIVIIVAINVSK